MTSCPRSRRYGTQKLVSRPPEKASTTGFLSVMSQVIPARPRSSACHQRLLDVQPVLGLVDVDRPRPVEHLVGDLDVAADRQAVAKQRVRRERQLLASTMKWRWRSRIGRSSSQRPK
jgi:hypothetical protein